MCLQKHNKKGQLTDSLLDPVPEEFLVVVEVNKPPDVIHPEFLGRLTPRDPLRDVTADPSSRGDT